METLTIKRGDKHDVRLAIGNSPLALLGGVAKVHVQPSLGGSAIVFNATVGADNIVTWSLDGTLDVGRFLMEVQVTLGLFIVTAPSNGMITLTVLDDLA